MIKINKKADCSGCHACVNVCPKKCIAMKVDEEGFLYPSVDMSKCVKCGRCQQVCHHHSTVEIHNQPQAYACYSTNEDIRMQSSSGGMFTVFAEEILNRGGAVFGAAFDEDLTVRHIGLTQKEDLVKLRGSKYVQSIIGDSYESARQILQSGRCVLFTGTPCQIGGLKRYLGKQYDNLYTADVICHGVPSPKVWALYLQHMEELHGTKVNNSRPPFFRFKTPGESGFSLCIHFENGEKNCTPFWQDRYLGAFVNDLTLRPSCYHCDFKSIHRNSDITLADFWGVEELMPEMVDHKGISLVLINSEKGKNLFSSIEDRVFYQTVMLDQVIKYNPSAYRNAVRPFKRRKFMDNINSGNFDDLFQKCANKGIFEIVYHKVTRLLKITK